jgi:hypothetical protein
MVGALIRFLQEQPMIRNQYEQDDRMLRGQAGSYGYPGGPYGQPNELQDERYFAGGNPARYESERAFAQWQAPQGYPQGFMAPFGAYGLPQNTGLLPHPLQAQTSPFGLGLAPDPWAAAYFQGVAPRAYFSPGLSPVHPLFGQGQMFRPPGLVPLINEPINRFAGMATANIGTPELILQQQLQQQQQLHPSATPASFRGVGPKGYVRSDERLKDDICERLTGHPDIDASDISIDVRQGVVSLTGTVNHRLAKHEVEDLVDNVIGVKDIENHILVRPRVENRSMAQLGEGQAPPVQVAKPRH